MELANNSENEAVSKIDFDSVVEAMLPLCKCQEFPINRHKQGQYPGGEGGGRTLLIQAVRHSGSWHSGGGGDDDVLVERLTARALIMKIRVCFFSLSP